MPWLEPVELAGLHVRLLPLSEDHRLALQAAGSMQRTPLNTNAKPVLLSHAAARAHLDWQLAKPRAAQSARHHPKETP